MGGLSRLSLPAQQGPRVTFTVHRSCAYPVLLTGGRWWLYAEDWPRADLGELAAQTAAIVLDDATTDAVDRLATRLARRLGVREDAPYGCALFLLPAVGLEAAGVRPALRHPATSPDASTAG